MLRDIKTGKHFIQEVSTKSGLEVFLHFACFDSIIALLQENHFVRSVRCGTCRIASVVFIQSLNRLCCHTDISVAAVKTEEGIDIKKDFITNVQSIPVTSAARLPGVRAGRCEGSVLPLNQVPAQRRGWQFCTPADYCQSAVKSTMRLMQPATDLPERGYRLSAASRGGWSTFPIFSSSGGTAGSAFDFPLRARNMP